jgi:hypothetical protein
MFGAKLFRADVWKTRLKALEDAVVAAETPPAAS